MELRRNFTDIEDLCHTLESWDVDMHPLSNDGADTMAGEVIQVVGAGYLYGYAGFNPSLKMSGAPPAGLITFNLMEPTPRPYWWRGKLLDSEMIWVLPEDGELRSISPPGFRVHTLSVSEEQVACTAAEYGIDLPPPSKRREVFRGPPEAIENIRSSLRRIGAPSISSPDELVDLILPALVSLWLTPETSGTWRRPSMRARDRAIRKALEIIANCDLDSLNTALFLEESCVSERTLQYAFLEHFASSPAALIKSLRLAATRTNLRRAAWEQKTVAEIAHEAGFQHMPQFAADYSRAFGELPSKTLGRPNQTLIVSPKEMESTGVGPTEFTD